MDLHSTLPTHIAIIMDGNRRWASKHRLPILMGHRKAAYEGIEPLVDAAIKLGISYLTLWAFSTENWQRSRSEVEDLLNLFRQTLSKNIEKLHRKGIRLKTIGEVSKFPDDIQQKLKVGEEKTRQNKKITLIMALNYGGRDEIVRAINKLKACPEPFDSIQGRLRRGVKNPALPAGRQKSKITEEEFNNYLDTAGIPDPDLIIRTGGERRLSGFLLWQSEYSELYFTETLFPDFTPKEFKKAIAEYQQRQRRFGR